MRLAQARASPCAWHRHGLRCEAIPEARSPRPDQRGSRCAPPSRCIRPSEPQPSHRASDTAISAVAAPPPTTLVSTSCGERPAPSPSGAEDLWRSRCGGWASAGAAAGEERPAWAAGVPPPERRRRWLRRSPRERRSSEEGTQEKPTLTLAKPEPSARLLSETLPLFSSPVLAAAATLDRAVEGRWAQEPARVALAPDTLPAPVTASIAAMLPALARIASGHE